MFLAVLFLLVVSQSQADQVASCPPPIWLPEGADFTSCGYSHRALSTAGVSIAYDGSKVPDCSAMPGLDVNDTVFVAHEHGEILMRPLSNIHIYLRLRTVLDVRTRGTLLEGVRRLQF